MPDMFSDGQIHVLSEMPEGMTCCFLAHLSRRLIDELIVYMYPCSGVHLQFQIFSSFKPLGQLMPKFV